MLENNRIVIKRKGNVGGHLVNQLNYWYEQIAKTLHISCTLRSGAIQFFLFQLKC